MSRSFLLRAAGALMVVGMLLLTRSAVWAHEQVDSGSYHFEIGWVSEPVIVGDRNGLDLYVAAKDTPDQGLPDLASTLKFTVEYGGASQEYELAPVEDDPGHYTAIFIPAREGQYTFHVTGTINDEAVDVTVEPEEVVTAGRLAFPAAVPSVTELAAQLADAQSRVGTAQAIAVAGLVLGLIGAGAGVFSLLKKR